MRGIFISYRRQDSQSAAGRLADHLKKHLAGAPVFRDVETIEPGVDFVIAINRALQSCGVLLAIIGPHWLSAKDASGRRRLENPDDYTRIEIATALKRGEEVRVIPVLVEGAQMPEPGDLPEDLQGLCRRHASELSDKRWDFDVSQLVEVLRKILNIKPQPVPEPDVKQPWYQRVTKKQWGIIATAVIVIGVLGGQQETDELYPYTPNPVQPLQPPVYSSPQPITSRTLAGVWQDPQGGRYRISEQSGGYRFESLAQGGLIGFGHVVNNVLTFNYTYRDAQYAAMLQISPDGNWMRGHYSSAASGENGGIDLKRVQ